MPRSCAYCYILLEKELRCSRCQKHPYCSRECQRADWKQHKLWCGRAAEVGLDIEVRDTSQGKGLGIFALRSFECGEKVLVERCVLKVSTHLDDQIKPMTISSKFSRLPLPIRKAVTSLYPGELQGAEDTYITNKWGLGCVNFKYNSFEVDSDSGLCITASRFNHACIPNCGRYYISEQELLVFSAGRAIAKGEELTISYSNTQLKNGFASYQAHLKDTWKFTCTCQACSDSNLADKLVQIEVLDEKLFDLGSNGREREAYEVGERMIALYDEVGAVPGKRHRTWYDMFQMAVVRKSTLSKAKYCLQNNLDNKILSIGGSIPEAEDVQRARSLLKDPKIHKLYLSLDGRK